MRSQQDQPIQSETKSQTQRTPTQNFIRQVGSQVEVGQYGSDDVKVVHALDCESKESARQLALSLSGTKLITDDTKQAAYQKLFSHPWYGTVLLEELTKEDRNFIALYIQENTEASAHDSKLKVHSLFIDDPQRPFSHALIQEILLVISFSGDQHE